MPSSVTKIFIQDSEHILHFFSRSLSACKWCSLGKCPFSRSRTWFCISMNFWDISKLFLSMSAIFLNASSPSPSSPSILKIELNKVHTQNIGIFWKLCSKDWKKIWKANISLKNSKRIRSVQLRQWIFYSRSYSYILVQNLGLGFTENFWFGFGLAKTQKVVSFVH